jgi:hypothetical protein
MPVLAAGLADVLVRDPDPLVGGGIGGHLLDQSSMQLLNLDAIVKAVPHIPDPGRKAVANPLQLVDSEHSRTTHPGNAELESQPWERR